MYKNPNTRLYIVTGPVLSEDLSKIPRAVHNVTIPKKYFKVAMDLTNKKAIAFVMPNAKNDAPLETFATSIDDVEALTGIDFFYQLEDGGEQALEAQERS
ncbi:MAG: DNA/RNA non-specific endonuclease [Saprospiraceae bacterium]|nr:DNA/RNA non-specific endonuclease [Saprospiraceae bacterium]